VLVTRTVHRAGRPALASAGGVVLDIGGPMSHGAMVAREPVRRACAAPKDAT